MTNEEFASAIAGFSATVQKDTLQEKIDRLNQRTSEKVNKLTSSKANISNYTDTDYTGTQVKHGKSVQTTGVHDFINQQEEFGRLVSEAQVYSGKFLNEGTSLNLDPNSNYKIVNGTYVKFDGPTRNAYIRNLGIDPVTGEQLQKFGLARNDLTDEAIAQGITPEKARYSDKTKISPYKGSGGAYDGTPGERGQSVGEALFEATFDADEITNFELNRYMDRSTIAARAIGLGPNTRYDEFGAGGSEYTIDRLDPLFNVDAPKFEGELPKGTQTPTIPYGYNKKGEKITNKSASKTEAQLRARLAELEKGPTKKSFLDQLISSPQAFASGFGKSVYDALDVYTEIAGDVSGRVVGLVDDKTGKAIDKWVDLGTEEEKTKRVNALVGYDNRFTANNMEEVGKLWDEFEFLSPSTWTKLADAAKTAFSDIETSVYSLGYLLPAIAGVTGKAGARLVGGVVKKHYDESATILKSVANGTMTKEAAKEATKKSLEAMSKTDRTKLFLVNNADALQFGAMMNNNQMDEYIKNNGGEDATLLRNILGTAANAAGMKLDIGVMNSILKPSKGTAEVVGEFLKGAGEDKSRVILGKMAELVTKSAIAGLHEMPQEWLQTFVEEFNKIYGTKDKAGKEIGLEKAISKSSREAAVGALAGLAGGVHTSLGVHGTVEAAKATPELLNVAKKGIQLATETPEQRTIRQNVEYSRPLKNEAMFAALSGNAAEVADRAEKVHGKLSTELDESAPKSRTYSKILKDSLEVAQKAGDEEAINNVYKTIAELDKDENVEFKATDLVKESGYENIKKLIELINRNVDITDVQVQKLKGLATEDIQSNTAMEQRDAEIIALRDKVIAEKKRWSIMGTDEMDPILDPLTKVENTANEFLEGKKTLDDVNKEFAELGFMDTEGKADPSRPGLATYEKELTDQLLNTKTNKNLLKVTEGTNVTRLTGLTKFAESRLNKLGMVGTKDAYQTGELIGKLKEENEKMLNTITNVLKTAKGLKSIDADTKKAYEAELEIAAEAARESSKELDRRKAVLATVTRPEGVAGALAFQVDADGESIQAVTYKNGEPVKTKIADVVDGKAIPLEKYAGTQKEVVKTAVDVKEPVEIGVEPTKVEVVKEQEIDLSNLSKADRTFIKNYKSGRAKLTAARTERYHRLIEKAKQPKVKKAPVVKPAKKESRASQIKAAAEIRIGEGEDEAAARVKAMFTSTDKVKKFAQSLNDEDRAQLGRMAEEDKKAQDKLDEEEYQKFSAEIDEIINRPEVATKIKTNSTIDAAKLWLNNKFEEKFDSVSNSTMTNKTLENVLATTSKSVLADIVEELGDNPKAKAIINGYKKLLSDIVKDRLEAKKEPLKDIRESIEKTEGALKDAINGVDDMNMKAALKNYYKAELAKLKVENKSIRKLIDMLETNINTMERDKLLNRFKTMVVAILEGIDKIVSTLTKHKAELDKIKKLQIKLRAEYAAVIGMIERIEKDYLTKAEITSKEVKTPVGVVKQYSDSVYGPMVELKDKRMDARRTLTTGMNAITKTPESALKIATEEIVLERIKELKKEGSLGAELLANNIKKFGLNSGIVRVLKLGTESVFGRMGADLFMDTAKLIENLPTKFKDVFANQDESKEELIKNIETMSEYIKNIKMNNIMIRLDNKIQTDGKSKNVSFSGLAIKYAKKYDKVDITDIEVGDTIAIDNDRGYKVNSVTNEGTITATKTNYNKDTKVSTTVNKTITIEDKVKLQKLNTQDSTFPLELLELLGTLDENVVTDENSHTFSKLNVSPKIETLVKFYTSKLIADTQAMVGLILSMDQSEMGKKLGIYDADEQAAMYTMAQDGKVLSASVRANIGNDLYKALGIKFDSSTPEFTVESFKSALGALVQAVAIDSGVMETQSVKYGEITHNTLQVNHDKVQSLLGQDKTTIDLTKAINKLQYITESTKRPLLSKEKPADRFNRKVMNTDVPLTDAENAALNKLDKIPLVLDAPRIEEYIAMEKTNKELFYKALGVLDIANRHKDNRGAIIAQNDKTIREWDLLKSAYYATKNGTEIFYVDWGKTVSDRFTVLNDIQYQESKLHRELVHATDQIAKIKLNNADDILMMKAAISNGLDMDPDKLSIETMVKNFDEMVKADNNGITIQVAEKNGKKNALHVAIDTVFKAMTGKNAQKWFNEVGVAEAMGEIFHESEGHHGHSAVKLLADWHKAIVTKVKTFKTKMQLEADAITSGMMITLLQIGTNKAMDMLEKGGFYRKYKDVNGNWIDRAKELEDYVKTWLGNDTTFNAGALIEAGKKHASILEDNNTAVAQKTAMKKYFTDLGHKDIDAKIEAQSLYITSDSVFKDLYSTIGVAMLEDVKMYKAKLEALRGTKGFTEDIRKQLALFEQIGELNLKNIRSIAKSPVMVYVYGASLSSIKKKLGYTLGLKPLLDAIEQLSGLYRKLEKGTNLDEDETSKVKELISFIDQLVPIKKYKNEYGKKVDITDMAHSERLLYLDIPTEVVKDLQENVDKMFGDPIEKAFEYRFGFMNDNRDAMKTLEIIAFEAYMLRLSDDVAKILLGYSKSSKGELFELSSDQLNEINAKLTAMGYGHAVAWDHGDRIDYQTMNKTGKVGTSHSITVRVGNSKPVTTMIKQWKSEVNTGAMATIPIHAIDGRFIMEVLTKILSAPDNTQILAGTSKNIYDALAMALRMEMLKKDSGAYNTTAVNTGFERSIMADQLAMVEGMLYTRNADGSIGEVDEEFMVRLVDKIGLAPNGSGRLSYIKESLRLGLGIGRMIDVLNIAEKGNEERLENSKLKFESNHMHTGPITPTTVDSVDAPKAKPFGPFAMLKKLLNDRFEMDKAQVQKEFKEAKVILHPDTTHVFGINDLFNYKNAVNSIGNVLKIKGVKEEDGKSKVELAENGKLYQLLGGQDQVEIRSKNLIVVETKKTKKLALNTENGPIVITGSQEYRLKEVLKALTKKGVKVVINDELKEMLVETGLWLESIKVEIEQKQDTLQNNKYEKVKELAGMLNKLPKSIQSTLKSIIPEDKLNEMLKDC